MTDTSRATTANELAETLAAFRDSLWACHESEPGSPISLEPSAASTLHNALHNSADLVRVPLHREFLAFKVVNAGSKVPTPRRLPPSKPFEKESA